MSFINLLSDVQMNYTMNRPLADGEATGRIAEMKALAPKIKDIDTWTSTFLDAAKRAEAEKRWADAASYYHQVEFFLPAGDLRNSYYDDFARTYALAMQGVSGYERIRVPYPGGHLPGFRLPAKGKEIGTFVFNGGYDSFVEEFYPFLKPLTELGYTVIGFDGPGQGGALRQGIFFEHAWEKPAKAIIDYFKLDAVDWLGASCGGYLCLRAAAFEPRIKHVISMPTSYWGVDMTLRQMPPGEDKRLLSLFKPATARVWMRSSRNTSTSPFVSTGASCRACTSPVLKLPTTALPHSPNTTLKVCLRTSPKTSCSLKAKTIISSIPTGSIVLRANSPVPARSLLASSPHVKAQSSTARSATLRSLVKRWFVGWLASIQR